MPTGLLKGVAPNYSLLLAGDGLHAMLMGGESRKSPFARFGTFRVEANSINP